MLRCNYRSFIEKFNQSSEYFIVSIPAREMFSEVQTCKRTLSRVFYDLSALISRHLDLTRDADVLYHSLLPGDSRFVACNGKFK